MKRSSKLLFSIPFFLTNTSVSEAAEALMRRSGAAIQNSVFAVYRTPFTNTAVRGVFSSTRILEASRQKKPTEEISLADVKSQVKRMEKNVNAKTLKLNKELEEINSLRADLERLSISSQKLKDKVITPLTPTSDAGSTKLGYSFLKTSGGMYCIPPVEQKRLARFYSLLDAHDKKVIACLLNGHTQDRTLPIWKDAQNAIGQIRAESVQKKGDARIELNYLQNLYKEKDLESEGSRSKSKR